MPAIQLTPAQRKIHRSEAHHLDPVVMIGERWVRNSLLSSKKPEMALNAHGLILKFAFWVMTVMRAEEMLPALADQLNAAAIQHIGKLRCCGAHNQKKSAKWPKIVYLAHAISKCSSTANVVANAQKSRCCACSENQRLTSGGQAEWNVQKPKKHRSKNVRSAD
jgi:RNA-binding protein YhbY